MFLKLVQLYIIHIVTFNKNDTHTESYEHNTQLFNKVLINHLSSILIIILAINI